jgi:hypothetical protein
VDKLASETPEMKVVADHLEEDTDSSELVDRLEAQANRDIAAATVTLR